MAKVDVNMKASFQLQQRFLKSYSSFFLCIAGHEGAQNCHSSIFCSVADARAGVPAAVCVLGPERSQTRVRPARGHFGQESVFWERPRWESTDPRGPTGARRGNSQMLRSVHFQIFFTGLFRYVQWCVINSCVQPTGRCEPGTCCRSCETLLP